MPEYVYIFRGVESQKQELSPDQMQRVMARWSKWADSFASRGAMRGGSRLAPEGSVIDSNQLVSDGPFVESKELVGGFFIVECDSLEEACELAKGCPGLDHPGMTVEVRPGRR